MNSDLIRLARVRALTSSGVARKLRLAAGLSLGEVARELGVGAPTLLRWETGERKPRLSPKVISYGRLLDRLGESPEMREAGFPASEPRADANDNANGTTSE